MNYQFDMTKLSIQDYLDLLDSNATKTMIIASRCSLIDVKDLPITEINTFMESFSKQFVDYIAVQFQPTNV